MEEAPRTVPLPLALMEIIVAALAEAMQVRAANEPPDHLRDVITSYAQTLPGVRQITAGATEETEQVRVHQDRADHDRQLNGHPRASGTAARPSMLSAAARVTWHLAPHGSEPN